MVTLRVPSVPRSKPARSPLWPQREVHFWIPISVSYKLSSDMDRSSELTRILIYWFLLQEYSAWSHSIFLSHVRICYNYQFQNGICSILTYILTLNMVSSISTDANRRFGYNPRFPTKESDKHHDGDCTNPWSNRPNFSLLFRSNKN